MKSSHLNLRGSAIAAAASLMASTLAHAQTRPTESAPPSPEAGAQQKPVGEQPQEIVVKGARSEILASPDRVSFNVANNLQVQTGTLADALRAVPGVEVDLEGRVSLRGDSGVEILIDGRPSAMLRGDSRGDAILSMPAGQIERVEVIANPSAAMSPEGSGGVINLVTKRVRKDTRSATIKANVGTDGSNSLNLSGAHSRAGLTVTGDAGYRKSFYEAATTQFRERLDPASGSFVPSRRESEVDSKMLWQTGRLAIDYDLDKKNRLSTELNYRKSRMDIDRQEVLGSQNADVSYERESEIDLIQRSVAARASWRHILPGREHELVADLTVDSDRTNRDVEAATDFAAADPTFERFDYAEDRSEYRFKLDYKKPVGEEGSLNFGYQGNLNRAKFANLGARGPALDALLPVPSLSSEFEYEQLIHAFYGTYLFDIGKLETQAGLRFEQAETEIHQITDGLHSENDYFRIYPTLHLSYELSKNDQLRGSYSRRIRRPSPQDLNPHISYIDPQNLRRGNPALGPEITDSLELAWQHRKSGEFYSVTGFYRRSRGGVTDIVSDLGGGVFLTTRANLATAERIGVELVANGKLGKTLSYNASGTFLWNEIDRRVGGVSAPRSGTTGTVRGNLSWQASPKDFFQLNGSYSGKQLLPQGYRRSGGILNIGYRRKVTDRLSFLLTGQNVLDSARQVTVFETPTLRDRSTNRGRGQTVLLGLTYSLGGQNGRQKPEPAFDFPGGGETPQ